MKKKLLVLLSALLILTTFFTSCFLFEDNEDGQTDDDDELEDNGGGTDTSVPSVPSKAPEMNADGLKFTFYGTHYSVTGYEAPKGATNVDLIIPATYKDLPVLTVGHRAFLPSAIDKNDVIRSIIVSPGIVTVESAAFSDCTRLTSVTLPDTVTSIGMGAFARCTSLPSVTIPASVTTLGTSVFEGCTSLSTINVAPENPNFCSVDGDLYSKDMKTLIRYAIGKTADSTSYTPKDTVTTLAAGALQASSFTKVILPAQVIRIEPTVFKDCAKLTEIEVAVTGSWWQTDVPSATSGTGINANNIMKKPAELAKYMTDWSLYMRKYVCRTV